jgi:mono/diheme cytochrome c family protein
MKRTGVWAAVVGAALVLTPLLANAQKTFDLGKREYTSRCAVCHGPTGKGDGLYMRYTQFKTTGRSDLTQIAKRNAGAFPFQQVYEYIDGTLEMDAHGPRDMPIWGMQYLRQARDEYRDEDFERRPYDPEVYTRTRILALTDYLNRLQVR